MNWYKVVISQAIINTLREKGVDDDILDYLSTIPNDIKGRLIYILTLFPHITSEQLIDIHESIYKSDPTVRKSYYTQILQWLQRSTIRLPEDSERIFKALSHYHNNKNNYTSKDISQYPRFQILEQEYRKLINQISKREELRNLKHEGSKLIHEDERWKVLDILTPEAASYYGKNTTWCTSGDSEECIQTAKNYINSSGLYIIIDKKNNEKYQATHDFKQVMDETDTQTKNKDVWKLLEDICPEEQKPQLYYYFSKNVIDNPWPPGEETISENAEYSYYYAKEVIKGRFELGEKTISKDVNYSYYYAKDVIQGRFPEGEKVISQDKYISYFYAKNAIKGRFPEGEEAISKDAYCSYYYAKEIMNGRFPMGEEIVSQSSKYSYDYARYILHSRFKLGENTIARDPDMAIKYARDVIQGRFPEGEEAISRNAKDSYYYAILIINGRFPEGEESISKDKEYSLKYAKNIIKGRFYKGEEVIFNDAIYRKQYIREMKRLGIEI